MGHGVADAAGVPAAAGEGDEPVGLLGDHEPSNRGVGDERLGDVRDLRDVDLAAVEKGATAAYGGKSKAHRRRGSDGNHGFSITLQGDERCPRLVAADEAAGAVDRVDHPAPRRVAIADDAELLADDRVIRPLGGDALAGVTFDGSVRLCHGRQVGLRVDLQIVCAKALHRDGVGDVGQLECEGEVVCHRRAA